jgi:Cu+-exporting ATPase
MSSAAVTGSASSGIREVELSTQGMTCAACAARVEKKLNAMDDVLATVNFATEKAMVTEPASIPVEQLVEEIERAGYAAEVLAPALAGGGPDAARAAYLRRRLIAAVVFFVPLSDLSVLLSLFPGYRFPGWPWVLVALAAPVAIWAAWPFHQAALKNAHHGTPAAARQRRLRPQPDGTARGESPGGAEPGEQVMSCPG